MRGRGRGRGRRRRRRRGRVAPIELDPNIQRRLFMKSASSAASGSGQQREKRPVTDTDLGMQTEDPMDMRTVECTTLLRAPPANTRRRILVKSEPTAVTTQEAGDGFREK